MMTEESKLEWMATKVFRPVVRAGVYAGNLFFRSHPNNYLVDPVAGGIGVTTGIVDRAAGDRLKDYTNSARLVFMIGSLWDMLSPDMSTGLNWDVVAETGADMLMTGSLYSSLNAATKDRGFPGTIKGGAESLWNAVTLKPYRDWRQGKAEVDSPRSDDLPPSPRYLNQDT